MIDTWHLVRNQYKMNDPSSPKSDWTGVIRHLSTSSAVNPMLVATLAAIIFGVPGLMFGPAGTQVIFTCLVFLPLIVFVAQVSYFTITNPDRLQNDRHVEQKMRIQNQIAMKTGGKTVTIDVPRDAALIDNPKAVEPLA